MTPAWLRVAVKRGNAEPMRMKPMAKGEARNSVRLIWYRAVLKELRDPSKPYILTDPGDEGRPFVLER